MLPGKSTRVYPSIEHRHLKGGSYASLVTSRLFGTAGTEHLEHLTDKGVHWVSHPRHGSPMTEEVLLEYPHLLQNTETIVCGDDEITKPVVDSAPQLRLICKHGVDVDKIATIQAVKRGIMVTNAPASNAIAVAEFTIGLMLLLIHDIARVNDRMRAGSFPATTGRQLSVSTVGVIGYGNIGRSVTTRLHAFGSTILVCDPYVKPDVLTDRVTLVSHDEIWQRADIITLHCRCPRKRYTFWANRRLRC